MKSIIMTIHTSIKICSVQLLEFPSWSLGKKCVNRGQWVRTQKGYLASKCSLYLWRKDISNVSGCQMYINVHVHVKLQMRGRNTSERNSESSPDKTTEYWHVQYIKRITDNNLHQGRKYQFNTTFILVLQIYRSRQTCLG